MILDNIDEIYEKVLEKLSPKVGIIDFKNSYHFSIFNELIKESKLKNYQFEVIQSLCEATDAGEVMVKNNKSGNIYSIQKKSFDKTAHTIATPAEIDASKKSKEDSPKPKKQVVSTNNKTEPSKSQDSKKRIINGKDKTLSKENPLESKEYQKELEPNDDNFSIKNKKFANPTPPPSYKLPDSILNNPKFPKRYGKLLERFMNTQPIGNAKKISHYSDFPGGAGKLQAQAGELLTMMAVTMNDDEFNQLQSSISSHLKELTTLHSELKPDGSRIVNEKWLKAASNNRKAIFKKINKQFPNYRIVASSWDTKNEVEALGMSNYNNKGYSTDIYLRLENDKGEPLLSEISLKQNLKVNLLNSGTGKFFEWLGKDNISDSINPQKFAKNQRKKISNFCNENVEAIKELVKTDNVLRTTIEEKGIDFETALSETLKGKGNRAKTKILLEACTALKNNNNTDAKKLIDDLDNDHATYVSESIKAVTTNPKLKEGMLNEIKNEFPLKSVADNEESVVLGEYMLDKSTMQTIFGTSDFNEFKEGLISQVGPPPFIAYKVKLGGRIIPIADIDIREDGRNYGGQFKFEMKINNEFAKEIIKANKIVYGE